MKLAARISELFDVPVDTRDIAFTLLAAPAVLLGLIAALVLLATFS